MFFTGLTVIPAVNAALIHKTLFIWVALLAGPFLKENLSRKQLIGVVLLFIGNLFVGGFKGFNYSWSEFLVFGATIFWAVENILAKKVLKEVDPDLVTLSRMGLGALILLGASVITAPAELREVFRLQPYQYLWVTVTAIALLAYVSTWYRALKSAPAVTVSAVLVSSTLITNVLSVLFITHAWNLSLIPQFGFMVLGILLFWLSTKEEKSALDIS
jgi:drug/metabolite transporter (DMT)-like permease